MSTIITQPGRPAHPDQHPHLARCCWSTHSAGRGSRPDGCLESALRPVKRDVTLGAAAGARGSAAGLDP